ncbi:cupredoxin domain-containing protein [Candidatus Micrarchaeota archaeon]|nr:cupredoxin domain-containing protein [Candidatus Micrarchaeota archaeon]
MLFACDKLAVDNINLVINMSDEIKIGKTTLFLFAGLLFAAVIGMYFVFSASSAAGATTSSGTTTANPSAGAVDVTNGFQEVYLSVSGSGYDKSQIIVKKGIPVRLHFTASPSSGCGQYMRIYGITPTVQATSRGQESVVEFTPQQAGTFEYNCGMRMFRGGKFIVTA